MIKNENIYIDKLSFFWSLKDHLNSDKKNIPDFLPFKFDYNDNLNLLIQKRDKRVSRLLDKVYKLGSNIGNIESTNSWDKQYGKDFINFIHSSILNKSLKKKRILEIGCGNGNLLKELKNLGHEVFGIEPSQSEKKENDIEIINDFFPSTALSSRQFDLIYHSCVLEHIAQPVEFLTCQFYQLKNGGALIISIPDCTENIASGDISMILHEHFNYFDNESLKKCVMTAGFGNIQIKKAKFGGLIYCYAEKPINLKRTSIILGGNISKYNNFLSNYYKNISKLETYIKGVLKDNKKTLGFYVPMRALPYISVLKLYKGYRFFDDNPNWHLKYFRGVDTPIENSSDLLKNPVTDLIIMSPTFGNEIQQKVIKSFSSKINVKKLTDFFK